MCVVRGVCTVIVDWLPYDVWRSLYDVSWMLSVCCLFSVCSSLQFGFSRRFVEDPKNDPVREWIGRHRKCWRTLDRLSKVWNTVEIAFWRAPPASAHRRGKIRTVRKRKEDPKPMLTFLENSNKLFNQANSTQLFTLSGSWERKAKEKEKEPSQRNKRAQGE